jgi:molybdenum cofactor cytidylyltransferase
VKIAAILLAAGRSSRMGRAKQLIDWHGVPLVRHVAQQALAADLAGLTVVVGAQAAEVRQALAGLALTIVENPQFAAGQATSLAAGLSALPADCAAALVLLVDQPLITPALINDLLTAYRADPADALIPQVDGQPGNPVILSAALFPELQELQGDEGARAVLRRPGRRVTRLACRDSAYIRDCDTPDQLAALQR